MQKKSNNEKKGKPAKSPENAKERPPAPEKKENKKIETASVTKLDKPAKTIEDEKLIERKPIDNKKEDTGEKKEKPPNKKEKLHEVEKPYGSIENWHVRQAAKLISDPGLFMKQYKKWRKKRKV